MRIAQDRHAGSKPQPALDLLYEVRSLHDAPVHVEGMLTSAVVVNAAAARKFEILLVTRHLALILEFGPKYFMGAPVISKLRAHFSLGELAGLG
ncbi:MAG TPA: hypothetical protein VMS18_13295 [Candidatus Binatia bacterium]|nr:hypothetical protein [Candidatus Binatia bacterium]